MIGAVGGSLMNLVYPYFLEAKGWRGPQYRRVQLYDFILGMTAMLVLNLAVWVLGAELLYPDRHIEHLEDLPNLLSTVARRLPAGCCSMRGSSRPSTRQSSATPPASARSAPMPGCGCATGRCPPAPTFDGIRAIDGSPSGACFRRSIWTMPGMPGFVALTLAANSAQVVLLPMLAGGLWWITASARLIGPEHRNRWWENAVMAILFALASYFAFQAVRDLLRF